MLVPAHSGWVVALDRFFEVSVGIVVGLVISAGPSAPSTDLSNALFIRVDQVESLRRPG
jgi:hypothetical protein